MERLDAGKALSRVVDKLPRTLAVRDEQSKADKVLTRMETENPNTADSCKNKSKDRKTLLQSFPFCMNFTRSFIIGHWVVKKIQTQNYLRRKTSQQELIKSELMNHTRCVGE